AVHTAPPPAQSPPSTGSSPVVPVGESVMLVSDVPVVVVVSLGSVVVSVVLVLDVSVEVEVVSVVSASVVASVVVVSSVVDIIVVVPGSSSHWSAPSSIASPRRRTGAL